VAVLVNDVESYLQFHVKGVAALVKNSEIPLPCRESFLRAKEEIQTGHAEEDLESQRINALYYMNHYLRAAKAGERWWRPRRGPFSAEINQLIQRFWDHGPFSKIAEWTKALKIINVIELGCGVGGLARILASKAEFYLGVDSAFASIALARHVYLGAPYALPVQIPQDLYLGPLTGKVVPPKLRFKGADFVVGEIEGLPVAQGIFDLCVALNTIDMIEDPRQLPKLQRGLLKKDGIALQSCPYIWHRNVAERLRQSLPKNIRSSSAAVELLYEKAGFEIFRKVDHLPWLFLKHFRQVELYSVHLFAARKKAKQ
jgi:SAM-dependent methyltransferase